MVFGVLPTHAFGQTLPAPWTGANIGSPALAGAASEYSGVFTIQAAGTDIWSTSDQFYFVYQAVTGDVDVRARVDEISYAHAWSKAGIMIRSALTASAAHGFAMASADKGLGFQRRLQAGGLSVHTAGEFAPPPRWVRLVRQGSLVTAYSSVNGTSWTLIGSDTVALNATAYVGLAVTSHNTTLRTTARLSNVTVTRTGLPSGQANADIGSPAIRGSASYAAGRYTIQGAGAGIGGATDQFHYLYQQMSGDGQVVARVTSLVSTNAWAKAGVMVRETLAANSPHAFSLVSATSGFAFQRRFAAAGSTTLTNGGYGDSPAWVRLVRAGSMFTAYWSDDGATWTTMASDIVNMAETVYVGIAVSSHNTSLATTAIVDSFAVAQSSAPVNKPPIVSLTAPSNGAAFTAPASIAITASASDPEGRMSAVEFYNGATRLVRTTTAPYSFSWTAVPAGTYTLTAVAFDADGHNATSAAVTVTVGTASNQLPTVSLTSPSAGATYTAPASITLSAAAADPEGRMSYVEFYNGTTLLARITAAPYSFSWTSVPAGTYALKAVARDADGGSSTSATVSVTVSAVLGPPRYAVFTASTDHATLVTSYRLEVFAAGANPATATPIATSDLGKPVPAANGDITVDRATFFSALATGSYVATVASVGAGGSTRSAPVTFTR